MVSCLGSLVQSCCGEGGALQTDIAVCGEHSQCSGHTGFAPRSRHVLSPSTLLRLPAALYGAGPVLQFSGTPQKLGLGWACVLCLPPPEQLRPPGAWRAHSPQCGAPSPLHSPSPSLSFCPSLSRVRAPCVCSGELASSRDPPVGCRPSRISGSQSLVTNWRPVCSLVGVPSLGPSLPLSPTPCLLPPVGVGPVHRQLALLWNCSVPLFCEGLAVCSLAS